MRKMYKIAGIACLGLMLSLTNINAQTADFENLALPMESYWDGSDLSGTHNNGVFTSEFTSGDFTFPNLFDTTWGAPGYWLGGFAYSNMTDSVTSGVGNKYSAKAGGGDISSNYVISSNNTSIKVNGTSSGGNALNMRISNSTYAYNSMRDGDAFAKKFGGPSGNDPDWFKVTIKVYMFGGFQDSLDYYLADFRFSDNSQDYIKSSWEDISILTSSIDSIYFEINSSDVGMWGMNTPAFFCLDNIGLFIFDGVDELTQNNFSFFPNPATNVLNIKTENNFEQLLITDMSGRTIKTINSNNTKQERIDVSDLNSGIYFIQVVSNGVSQVQKFIKQ